MQKWKSWCRLCASREANGFDIFVEDLENKPSIADDLKRSCNLKLENTTALPSKICSYCHVNIKNLKKFLENVFNTQQMFVEFLQTNPNDWDQLREKYKLPWIGEIKDMLTITEFTDSHQGNNLKGSEEDYRNNSCEEFDEIDTLEKESSDCFVNGIRDAESLKDIEKSNKRIKNNITKAGKNIPNNWKANIPKNNIKKSTKFQCRICENNFSSERGFTNHMRIKHSILKDPYKCKLCDKTFEIRSRLKIHEKAHIPCGERKQLSCPHCEKKFNSEGGRWSHIHSVHDKKQAVICEECGKEFRTKRHLAKHKISHSQEKNLQCPHCPARFKAKGGLNAHILIHGESFPCSICGILLNTKHLLKKHMVVHSDVKDFKCNFCNKDFKRLKDLHCHLIIHMGIRPYECRICGERFVHKVSYHRHLKATHPIQFAEMVAKGERISYTHFPSTEQLKAINEAAKCAS